MTDSLLYQLIQQIEYKTNLHIVVLFFKNYGNMACKLPSQHQIHASPICDYFKRCSSQSYSKCLRCRNFAIKKALKTKQPFGALCVNGVYEYTHPVLIDGDVAAVIFIGNILDGKASLCKMKQKSGQMPLPLDTLEKDFSPDMCQSVCRTIENYILFLLKNYNDAQTDEKPLIRNIKNYIKENLDFELYAKNLVETFYYNPRYLCRLFKKETGLSLNDYIRSQRLKRAEKLLVTTAHSIIEISTEVGFKNVTYFNKVFKAAYQTTPTDYRKQHQQ